MVRDKYQKENGALATKALAPRHAVSNRTLIEAEDELIAKPRKR